MSRGIIPVDVPFRTAIAFRTQAHEFLHLALNSDDRIAQAKYLNAAREVLAEMEVAIERVRSQNLAEASSDSEFESESAHDSKSKDGEDEDQELDEEEESEGADEEGDDESEEDQQWGEDDQQWGEADDEGSDEEEWDINNGENSITPPTIKDPFVTHYFINGPGKPGLLKDAAAAKPVNSQHNPAANNLNIRVYARLMELFEIESRHRLEICNAQQALREKAARGNLAKLNMSKLVSDPV